MKIIVTYIFDYGNREEKSQIEHLMKLIPTPKEMVERSEITLESCAREFKVEE